MCLQPYAKKNPNFGLQNVGLNYLKDTTSQYINIPCGVCPECIASKQMALVQRIQVEAKFNYLFFCTLTYDNEHLPSLTTSTGFDIRYADIHDLQLLFKRLRDSSLDRPFRYFAVSELGSKRGRPHFHIIFLIKKFDGDTPFTPINYEKFLFDFCKSHFAKNVGSRKNPIYEPLFTYVRKFYNGRLRSNFDLHYVVPSASSGGCSDVAFYCIKYMMKPSDRAIRLQQALHLNLDEAEYDAVWNIVKPRYVCSKCFGLDGTKVDGAFVPNTDAVEFIKNCVSNTPSSSPFPYFYKDDGTSWPLARFYRMHPDCFSVQDAHDYFYLHSSLADYLVNKEQSLKKFSDYEKKVLSVDDSDTSALLDWLE